MRAVVYETFGGTPFVTTVADPEPPVHGVVVEVEATGLCRSDWHGWQGHDADITDLPHVPGHELAGTIVAVGADVARHRIGDRVTVPFVCACGTCPTCAGGNGQICDNQRQPGFTHWGSFAEYVALDWADVNLVPLPPDLAFDVAAALGCRYATAYRAVLQLGRLQPGERVAVHGCGGVGLSAIQIALAHGAEVYAVDPDPAARSRAEALGAQTTDLPPVQLSIEAIGHPAALQASIAGLAKRGRHVQVGLLPRTPQVPMATVIARELELLGSHGLAAQSYPALLHLVTGGRLDPGALIETRIGLDDAPRALTEMAGPGMTMIYPPNRPRSASTLAT